MDFKVDPAIAKSLFKVFVSAGSIALIGLLVLKKRLSIHDLALERPNSLGRSALWVCVYLALMLSSNAIMDWRGPWDFTVWREQGLIVGILRVAAVGLLGPIGEELIFRGVLQGVLFRRKGSIPSTLLPAVAWAALHYVYTIDVIVLLFFAGALLGIARDQTRSVYVPIVMHILWNLYAIW